MGRCKAETGLEPPVKPVFTRSQRQTEAGSR